jgi:hypothetical protein
VPKIEPKTTADLSVISGKDFWREKKRRNLNSQGGDYEEF